MKILKNSLNQSHDIVRKFINLGDIVVDATCGNGNDTLFLAQLVGSEGKVISFDIQNIAIEKSKQRLKEYNLLDRVDFIKSGHENIDAYVKGAIRAVMFNLGYLPQGDHKIATKSETTIIAIRKSMDLIDVNGIISIVIYSGGDTGFEEREDVLQFLRKIDSKKFNVMKTEFINQANNPPILVCIEKLL